jgi:hypothetical protein
MSLIYTRSPFFIQSTSGSTATVSLYVWNGNSSDVPSTPQYSLSKSHNSDGKATFEVSELIRDYVDQSFNGDYVTEAVWVYISMADGAGTGVSSKYLATDGYIDEDFVQYWSKSDSNLKSDEVLMSNDYISVPEDTTAMIPTKDADIAVFYKEGEVKFISELADKNLLANSETFYSWSSGSSLITSNVENSPIGYSYADRLNKTSSFSSIGNPGIPTAAGVDYTLSLYVKKDSGSFISLRLAGGSNDVRKEFNLNTFAVTDGTAGNQNGFITSKIETIGSDWYRVSITCTANTTAVNLNLYAGEVGNTTNDGQIIIFGAQLEKSSHPTEYSNIDSNSSGAINYATSAGQSASTFYARVMKDGGTIIDENCSDDIMEYVSELDIDEAHVIKSDGKVEVISVETLPCNKYENVRLTFVNKFGALQDVHFSAKTTESMSAKGSSYNSINFDYDNLSNNYGRHSVRDFNKNATVRHTLNTDYLHESYSEVFRQLIVSEEVWMEHKGDVRPVNVTTNSLQKKTHANNGLVQFTVSVKESHSLINNIR